MAKQIKLTKEGSQDDAAATAKAVQAALTAYDKRCAKTGGFTAEGQVEAVAAATGLTPEEAVEWIDQAADAADEDAIAEAVVKSLTPTKTALDLALSKGVKVKPVESKSVVKRLAIQKAKPAPVKKQSVKAAVKEAVKKAEATKASGKPPIKGIKAVAPKRPKAAAPKPKLALEVQEKKVRRAKQAPVLLDIELPDDAPIGCEHDPAKMCDDCLTPKASIMENAVILRLRVRVLGNTRRVDEDKLDVKPEDTEEGWVRANKDLLHSIELRQVNLCTQAIRAWLKVEQVPGAQDSMGDGAYLLPLKAIPRVMATLGKRRAEWEARVDLFCSRYRKPYLDDDGVEQPSLIDQAEKRLGVLFDASNYKADPRGLFRMTSKLVAYDTPTTLKSLPGGIYEAQLEQARQEMSVTAEEIKKAMRQGMATLIQQLVTAMDPGAEGKKKGLRAPMVEKFKGFLSAFDERNVIDDKELAVLVDRARSIIDRGAFSDVKALRNDADTSQKVRVSLMQLGAKLGMEMEVKGRAIAKGDEE